MNDKEISDVVESALNSVLPEMEDHREGDILIEWVLVAYVTNPDPEKESAYPMLCSNADIPSYRARGLLATGLECLPIPE